MAYASNLFLNMSNIVNVNRKKSETNNTIQMTEHDKHWKFQRQILFSKLEISEIKENLLLRIATLY